MHEAGATADHGPRHPVRHGLRRGAGCATDGSAVANRRAYCYGRPHADSNSNGRVGNGSDRHTRADGCTHANTNADSHSVTHAYRCAHCQSGTDSHADGHTYANAAANSDPCSNRNPRADADRRTHGNCHSCSNSHSDGDTLPDPAPYSHATANADTNACPSFGGGVVYMGGDSGMGARVGRG